MTNFGLALGIDVLAPAFLAILVGGCSGSETSFGNGKTTTAGSGGAYPSSTAGGNSGTFSGTTGTGGTGSAAGAAGTTSSACTVPMVVTAMPTGDVLTNLDMDSAVSGFSPGGGWFSYKDDEPTGMLSPDNSNFMTESPGANESAAAVHVVGSGFMSDMTQNYGGGVGFSLASPKGTPGDLSGAIGFTFYAKSGKASDPSDIKIAVSTTATDPTFCICNGLGCYNTHFMIFQKVSASWSQLTVRWTDLKQAPDWGYRAPFDPKTVLTINFVSNGALPAFDFWVDEVSLIHQQ